VEPAAQHRTRLHRPASTRRARPLAYSAVLRRDGGDLCQDDKAENELSLKYGLRLMSSYQITETEKLWVITEGERSVTTLLLPAEY
jgi:hypothetical protein